MPALMESRVCVAMTNNNNTVIVILSITSRGIVSSIPTFLDGSVQDSSDWTTVIDNGVVPLHYDFISTTQVKGNTRL
jgi:hypothetical protein